MIVVVVIAGVLLAAVAVFAVARSRQSDQAVGVLSRETQSRDAVSSNLGEESQLTGKQVERAADLERKNAGQELVLAAKGAPPAPYVPADPDTLGVTRRQFFNRSIVLMFGLGISGFGTASIAFLWPQVSGGFGSKLKVGLVSSLLADIRAGNGFLYKAEGRMWLTEYPNGAAEKAAAAYSPGELSGMLVGHDLGLDGGIVALYQ